MSECGGSISLGYKGLDLRLLGESPRGWYREWTVEVMELVSPEYVIGWVLPKREDIVEEKRFFKRKGTVMKL